MNLSASPISQPVRGNLSEARGPEDRPHTKSRAPDNESGKTAVPLKHLKQAHAKQWNHHVTPPAYRARIIVVVEFFAKRENDTGSGKALLKPLERGERK